MIYDMGARVCYMICYIGGNDILYDILYGGKGILYDILYGDKGILYDILYGAGVCYMIYYMGQGYTV